jgi:hypothetical protein
MNAVKIFVGKCGNDTVEIKYGTDTIYKPHPPCKMVWEESMIDLQTFAEFTMMLLKDKGWVYKKQSHHKEEPVIIQYIWDEWLEGPAYVMFTRKGSAIAAYMHTNAGGIDTYNDKDKSTLEKYNIRDMVKEYDQHPDYVSLM